MLRLSRPHVMAKLKRPSTWKDRRLACNRPEKKAGDEELVNDIKKALVEFPSFGYKRIAAIVNRARRKHQKDCVNRKKVYRVAKQNDLLLKKATPSLPGQSRDHNGKVSVDRSDERWCSDGAERLSDSISKEIANKVSEIDRKDYKTIYEVLRLKLPTFLSHAAKGKLCMYDFDKDKMAVIDFGINSHGQYDNGSIDFKEWPWCKPSLADFESIDKELKERDLMSKIMLGD